MWQINIKIPTTVVTTSGVWFAVIANGLSNWDAGSGFKTVHLHQVGRRQSRPAGFHAGRCWLLRPRFNRVHTAVSAFVQRFP